MVPTSAAVVGLYNSHCDSHSRSSSHFRHLTNDDIPLIVRILLSDPRPQTPQNGTLEMHINSLPSYLRASGFHKSPSSTGKVQPGYLCDLHKHLKKGLCYELMAMIRHEIMRIGDYTYPIIMSGMLNAQDEALVRQLEPVPQMYTADFDVQACVPERREPIYPGHVDEKGVFVATWLYEVSQCPACMLVRIGRHNKVLSALLAGLVARISRRRRGPQEDLKSRRVRFVKEWLQACEGGRALVDEAFHLGARMRDIRRLQRAQESKSMKRARKENCIRVEISGNRRSANMVEAPSSHAVRRPTLPVSKESVEDIDISEPYGPQHQQASTRTVPMARTPIDQESGVGVDISEPFIPQYISLGNNVSASEEEGLIPRAGARGTDRDSEVTIHVGIDISEPFHPIPRAVNIPPQPTSGVYTLPASPARLTPIQLKRRSPGNTRTSTTDHLSIASSFGSNVSLSDLRPRPDSPSLYPAPLRTPNKPQHPPEVPERRLPRPHPLSIYGTYGEPAAYTLHPFAHVSPPVTPTGRDHPAGRDTHAEYGVSPPSSLEREECDISPPGTPTAQERPVTSWGDFCKKSMLP